MACISKRRGRYVVDFRDQNGKRHWKSYRTAREAKDALAELHQQVRSGTYRDPASLPTFTTIADNWLRLKQDHPASTLGYWRSQVERHFKPVFGPLRIDHVTRATIEHFRNAKRDGSGGHAQLARATINQLLQNLSAILDYAVDHGHILVNPGRSVKRIRVERRAGTPGIHSIGPKEVFTAEQAGLVIESAKRGLYRTYIATSLHTGARSGELLALAWAHLDLKAGTMRIERSLSWVSGEKRGYGESKPVFGPPKTDSSYRTLDLAADLVRELSAWRLQSRYSQDTDLVFSNSLGKPLHRAFLHKGLQRAIKAANERVTTLGIPLLPHVDLHGLRHSFASIMIQLGKPVSQVANLLGHKNAELTLKVYTHWFASESSASAIADLAAAMRRPVRSRDMSSTLQVSRLADGSK